jgi:biopolymer transport protein ExbD
MSNLTNDTIERRVSGINITPLVDIVLVLLIIFMVVTPMLHSGIPAQVPKRAPSVSPKTHLPSIVLQIDANDRMSINKQRVTMDDLGMKMAAIYATRPDKVLFVDAADNASYAFVVKALDVARGRGKVETIGFILSGS